MSIIIDAASNNKKRTQKKNNNNNNCVAFFLFLFLSSCRPSGINQLIYHILQSRQQTMINSMVFQIFELIRFFNESQNKKCQKKNFLLIFICLMVNNTAGHDVLFYCLYEFLICLCEEISS
jgi:hypothetical protein